MDDFTRTADGKTIVGVDADGVLAGYDQLGEQLLATHGFRFPAGMRRSMWGFGHEVRHIFGDEAGDWIQNRILQPGFFTDLPVIDGADAAIAALIDAGFHPIIVTAPMLNHPTCASEKLAWIRDNLPSLPPRGHVVITNDKTLVRSRYLIDDRPTVDGACTPTWEHVLFATPGNEHMRHQHHPDLILDGWNDIERLLDICDPERGR
jgi:5'(3')-deoxyribonucleotidase